MIILYTNVCTILSLLRFNLPGGINIGCGNASKCGGPGNGGRGGPGNLGGMLNLSWGEGFLKSGGSSCKKRQLLPQEQRPVQRERDIVKEKQNKSVIQIVYSSFKNIL